MSEIKVNTQSIDKILKQLTILYVEDEDNIRVNIAKTLHLICKEVLTAQNAETALELFKSNKIDIILSDINLPKISGLEFTKLIREEYKTMPIILLTAHTDTKFLLEATKLKLVDYLTKPIDFDSLFEALKKAAQEIIENGSLLVEFKNNTSYNLNKKLLINNETQDEIKLTSSEIELLEYFLKYKDSVVSADQLFNALWEDPYDATPSALKNILNKLRNKIGKESISNISGVGYRIILK